MVHRLQLLTRIHTQTLAPTVALFLCTVNFQNQERKDLLNSKNLQPDIAKHTAFRRKSKDWLNQNNVSEWSDMSTWNQERKDLLNSKNLQPDITSQFLIIEITILIR
jgi:hypothetical protein